MDVSFNNVLESTRQYFQGVPANSPPGAAGGGGGGGGGVGVGQPPSQQQQPPLSYWPPKAAAQRPSQDQTNAAAANAQMHAQHQPQQSHYAASAVATGGVSGSKAAAAPPPHRSLYNGTRTAPTSDVTTTPAAPLNQRHNLPPIAALTSSAYGGHSRATAVAARHHTPLPSISQITPHKSLSQNRNQPPPTHHFRSPDYPYSSANNRTSNPQYSMQKYSTTNYPNTTTPNTANYPNVSTPSSASYSNATTSNTANYPNVSTPSSASYSNATTPNAANYPNVSTPSTASYSKATTPNTASYSNATTPNPANYPNVSTPSTAYSNTSTPNTASYPNVSTPSTGSYSKATTPNTASYSNASTPNTANYPNVSTPSKASYSIATTPSSANYPNVSTPSKASYSIATTPNSANYSTPSTATSFSTSPTSVSYSMSSATVVTSSTTLPTAVQQSPYPAHSSSSSSYPTPTSNSSHSSQQSMYSTHSSSGTTYPTTTSSTSSAHSSHYPTTHSTSGSAYPTTTSSSSSPHPSIHPTHSTSGSTYPTTTSSTSSAHSSHYPTTHSTSGSAYPTTTSSSSSPHPSIYPTHSTSASTYPTTTSSSSQQQGSLYPSHSSSSYPSNASASARYQYQQQMYQNAMYQQQRQSEMGKVSADQQHYRNQMAAAGKAGGAGRQQYATHVQQQHQAYYSSPTNPVRSSHTPQQLSQQPPITTIANNSNQQQTTTSQNSRVNSGMMKRESPLDLSVKTVRQSADSTAKDESSENYLSGYHHHEMLRSTTKTPPKAANNHRQLPSMQYPNYQATTESNTAAGGAPKVDFLPNFSATNYQATTPAAAYTPEPKKRSRKSVTPNLSTGQYPNPYQNANSVANLKKSLPSNLYDYKQNSYYPPNTVVPSPQSKSGQNRNGNMYSGMSADAAYLLDVKQFQHQSRMDYLSQQVTNQTAAESSYKRASTTDLNNPRQAKIPKFDQWKQKFDEQIDLRFKSYASSKLMSEQSVNGVGAKDSSAAVAQNQSVYAQSRYQGGSSSGQNQIQPPISSSQSMASKHHPMYSQPPQRSESGANSSGGNSYNHSMYSTKQSQDVSNYQTGSRLSSSTGSAANKQVLSILRNSLEIREARNLQIAQQQQQVAQEQQYQQKQILHHRGKSYYHLEPMLRMPPQATIPGPPPQNSSSAQSKPPPGVPSPTPPPRHNLPPFGAIAVDRSSTSTPPYPGYKFHLPKAMDSVLIEDHDGARMHRTAGGVEARVSAAPETLPPTTGADSPTATEMDGLAAFLAARIRTKAELKQVGPGIAGSTASTIPGSNGSVHSPRTTPGIFSPLPAQARTPDIAKGGPSECESAAGGSSGHLGSASSVSTTASPPKLTRERNPLISPRRLFRSDDDSFGTTANTAATTSLPPTGDKFASGLSQQPQPQALQSRDAAPRSSSEASVFDFRESDSDGEMPVLERQSLRSAGGGSGGKQRRSAAPGGRKSAATAAAAAQQSTSEMELPEEPPDPFWSATCDDFLTQLTTGKSLLKRRGRRKKKRLKTPPPSTITAPPSPPLPTLPLTPLTPASAKTAMTDLVPPIKRVKEEKTNEEKVKIKKEREKIKEEKEKGKVVVKEEKEKLIEEEVKRKVVKEEKEKIIDNERKSKVVKEEKEKVVKEEKQKVKKEEKDKERVREKEKVGRKEIVVKEEKVVEKEKERAIEKIVKEEKVVVEKDKERVREKSVKEEKLVEKEKERLRVKEEKGVEKGKKEFICDKILEVKAVKLELGESSDEDVPLSKKLKRGRKPAIKEEPQSEMEDANSSEEEEESNKSSRRLRERKPREQKRSASEEKKNSEKSSKKQTRSLSPPDKKRQKEKDKQPKTFGGGGGDGSKFAPGWEEDLLKYKKSLRMPARLITISRPANWPRATASLPDLDSPLPSPSPHTNDSADVCLTKKSGDTDEKSKEKLQKSGETDEKSKEKSPSKQEDSFLNRLVQRYGNKGKKSIRKTVTDLLESSDRKPKKIENSNEPELLPTPRLDELIKTPGKKEEVEVKVKKPRGRRPKKDKEIKEKESVANCDSNDNNALYLGYFRKKTVAEFREAFEKHNGAFVGENDLPPVVYESRTRTQTRVLKQQATIREVFGDDRPASAPPAGCRSGDEVVVDNQAKKPGRRKLAITKLVLRKRGNSNSGNRPGLRSAAQLRSSKAVLNSKRQLLRGRQKRNNLKAFVAKQEDSVEQSLSSEVLTTKPDTDILLPPPPPPPAPEAQPGGKKLKLRRKLKSSGFDYIRKKKKQKKDGEMEPPKEKRKSAFSVTKSGLESEQDIQNEIKGWVINKGLGETVLHRAARLGYTDVVAYCLEKLGNNPSPRDNAGYTPLYEACSRNHIEIARLLLLHGANPSDSAQGGIRLLHEASENGFVEVMRLLLSFGADPLLATYAGHTPLSLASTQEARALLQHHLADVQGASAPPWHFNGLSKVFDMEKSGNDPTADAPEAEGEGKVEGGGDELVVEYSEEGPLPNLYTLHDEDPGDRWLLFQEVCATLRIKTRDALLRQLGPAHKNDLRDLKLTEFYDQAHSCMLMSAGDQLVNPRAHKVVMVKYTEQLRKLMRIERDSVPIS